jgi:hypothetical protein
MAGARILLNYEGLSRDGVYSVSNSNISSLLLTGYIGGTKIF